MEAFIGTWELVYEESSGVEEYIQAWAADMSDMVKTRLRQRTETLIFRRDGDEYFTDIVSGDFKDTIKLCFGEEYTYKFGPLEQKVTLIFENGKILGTHISNGNVIKSVESVSGDRLIKEINAHGVTMVTKYKRAS